MSNLLSIFKRKFIIQKNKYNQKPDISGKQLIKNMATGSLYDITQLQIEDEEVLADAGGKSNWSALSSALQTNVSYEFVSE